MQIKLGLTASLKEIDTCDNAVFVMHEKSEKLIPFHTHSKGQLSFVEGGIAYITSESKTYIVPARHFFWIPKGMPHVLRLGNSATILHSLYFYAHDDSKHEFYSKMGIYPASELLIQMIQFTEIWDGRNVQPNEDNFEFLISLKNILTRINKISLSIMLPITEDKRMNEIILFLEMSISEPISLSSLSTKFNVSERTLSRMFQSKLHMTFLQYFKTIRIVKALELILKTNMSMSEISYAVGYDTLGAFSNTFRSFTNSRPTEFRKFLKQ